ncbi:unnamed protein product [Caenorhabditis auriculariae]|uniref:WH1 domain-containing protein n=1 Tax=Caenorhabditis auriculariae TaxID=2777116 RepID=A0A8S1HVM5_9PELO|nr:unnamed protein product [Caenorhabditis auriculariae]
MTLLISTLTSRRRRISIKEFLHSTTLFEKSSFASRISTKRSSVIDPSFFFSTDTPVPPEKSISRKSSMYNSAYDPIHSLSSWLSDDEKESVLKALDGIDCKVEASGICRLVRAKNGSWNDEHEPGLIAFVKDSAIRKYRLTLYEVMVDGRSARVSWSLNVSAQFQTSKEHDHLVTFSTEIEPLETFGLNFYDKEEAKKFHEAVSERKSRKSPKRMAPAPPSSENEHVPMATTTLGNNLQVQSSSDTLKTEKKDKKKKKKGLEYSPHCSIEARKRSRQPCRSMRRPIFKHLSHVGLNSDQAELYQEVLAHVEVKDEEEKLMLAEIVKKHDQKIRRSLRKNERKTPKGVKNKSNNSRNGKSEPEDRSPTPAPPSFGQMPVDPLNPDWDSEAPSAANKETIRATASFRLDSVRPAPVTEFTRATYSVNAPRNDVVPLNERQPHMLYRFESKDEEAEDEAEEAPPLPDRSKSLLSRRPTPTSVPRFPNDPPPRLPSHRHRASYRWATADEHREADDVLPRRTTAAPPQASSSPPPPPVAHHQRTVIEVKVEEDEAPHAVDDIPPIASSAPPAPPPPPPNWSPINKDAPIMRPTALENNNLKKPSSLPSVSVERQSLLAEIQNADKSKMLRKVSDTPPETSPRVLSDGGGFIDQIQQFLIARRLGISPSDEEESDDSESEGWSD